MDRTTWVVTVIAVLVWTASPLFSTEPADHPFVGRFDGAVIHHQEVSRFGQYTLTVGEDETLRIEGEVWMTLYDAPLDSSTFSIYSTYRSFLEAEGFEMLLEYRPGDAPSRFLSVVYERTPFANHGNYNHSAPITNGNDTMAAYLTAKREDTGGAIYVSIAIAAGWYTYPQYKLDVIQTGTDLGRIVSTGTRTDPDRTADDEAPAVRTPADPTAPGEPRRQVSGTGSFRIRSGMAGYLFMDPAIAGVIGVEATGDPQVIEGQNAGFKNVRGPFFEAAWFMNENVGLTADFTRLVSDVSFEAAEVVYQSSSTLMIVRAGLLSRIVGSDYPATVGVGFGGGLAIASFVVREQGEGFQFHAHAEKMLPALSGSVEFTIPIVGFASFSSGVEYLFMPFDELTFRREGSLDTRTYRESNLGGLSLRLGLVAEF